jgi:hypothetical protein
VSFTLFLRAVSALSSTRLRGNEAGATFATDDVLHDLFWGATEMPDHAIARTPFD